MDRIYFAASVYIFSPPLLAVAVLMCVCVCVCIGQGGNDQLQRAGGRG